MINYIKTKVINFYTDDPIARQFFELHDLWDIPLRNLRRRYDVDYSHAYFRDHPEYVERDSNGRAYAYAGDGVFESLRKKEEIEKILRKKSPIAFFLLNDLPDAIEYPFDKIHELKWKFKYRFVRRHQYNRLETGLEPGYYDKSESLMYGIFHQLVLYVDRELGGRDKLIKDLEEYRTELQSMRTEMSQEENLQDNLGTFHIGAYEKQISFLEQVLDIYDYWENRKNVKKFSVHSKESKKRAKQIIDIAGQLWT